MKPLRRAAARLRDAGSIPVLAALLALAVSAPLVAGEHNRPHDSSDQGRSAQPRSDSGSRPSSPPPSSGGSSGGSSGWGSPSSPGQEPRVAVPRSESNDDSHQQRPQTGSRGGYHGGGGGGGYYGGYRGGYYGGYHHNYWGPYWGWGLWDWWFGDDYYGYYPGYNYPRYYGDRYGDRYDRGTGALDIDVSPGKAEVWIDGRYTGTADDFDGFPQYLWLDKGVYDLVLYREGYTTIARQVTVYGGSVVSIDDRMQRGESVKPQDLATKTHERRDERVRSEDERRDELARRDQANMDDWRERARRRIEDRDRYDRGDQNGRDEAAADGGARLHLQILPSDASVYLDGKFIGTGVDLERLRQGVRVEPGEHRIAVVRPGHKADEQRFTAAAGQDVDLNIELESME
jgi:hypothetical protein